MAAYGTAEGFMDWLVEHGHDLPDTSPWPDVLLARAAPYVDAYEALWSGSRTGTVMQDLGWPRSGASLNCIIPIPDDVIPVSVVNAAYRAAWLEAVTPGILAGTPVTPGSRVKRQKVDVIEREFFDDGKPTGGSGPSFIDSMIDSALRQFVCAEAPAGGAFVWSLGS